MSAKRQASITSFFQRKVTDTPSTPKAKQSEDNKAIEERKPLKRNNADSVTPVATPKSVKRKRVIVSSDEECDDENEAKLLCTPKTPRAKRPSPELPETPKTARLSAKKEKNPDVSSITEGAESFINSFKLVEYDSSSKKEAKFGKEDKFFSECDVIEKYDHENFQFLKPEKIKDGKGRSKTDPEYDPKTLFVPADFLSKQTPGHRQWWTIKAQHFDTVLFFKVGKFYELYHMDAVTAVSTLNIAYMRGSYAHAGFPEHAYGKFADQLTNAGLKVARIEQTETPQQLEERNTRTPGQKEKVVKRELCRITTTGTRTYGILDGVNFGDGSEMVDSAANHLIAIKEEVKSGGGGSRYGICTVDTSTGLFCIGQFEDDDYRSYLRTLLANVAVAQVLVERANPSSATKSILNGMLSTIPVETLDPKKTTAEKVVKSMSQDEYFGSEKDSWPDVVKELLDQNSVIPKPSVDGSLALSAFAAVFLYLQECLIDVDMITMRNFIKYDVESGKSTTSGWKGKVMVLDGTTLENLNIVPNGREDQATSLYNTINNCSTPFGRRLLRKWLCAPTCDPEELKQRQDAVEWMTSEDATSFVKKVTDRLRKLPDLERLLQKIHTLGLKYRAVTHPDSRAVMFDATRTNKRKIAELLATINGFKTCDEIRKLYDLVRKQGEGCSLLDSCLGLDESGNDLTNGIVYFEKLFDHKKAEETGRIEPKKGMDEEYDAACDNETEVLDALDQYRKEQQSRLKCKITYYGTGRNRFQMELEDSVTVPKSFELRSRRKGFNRYSTDDLDELIRQLSTAETEREKLASDATRKIFENFDKRRAVWKKTVDSVAVFDVILSLAKFATTSGLEMTRPEFDYDAEKPFIDIKSGTHPCLALQVGRAGSVNSFIANDTKIGGQKAEVMLLTGPNMGGKSTIMRQTAVLAILAHMGSFVPAKSMKMSPVDRIFTRIGANDRIMCGQSTFYVELKETQVMLRDATRNSLLLIDELGRGTSTFDGTAIASAVLVQIANELQCRTFFSTHYHTICSLAQGNEHIMLAHMACVVENENDEDPTEESVTFLYQLTDGVCPKSYGFYAAKLAGISDEVVRAAYAASNRFADRLKSRKTSGCNEQLRRVREAAARDDVSVEELQKMVAAL